MTELISMTVRIKKMGKENNCDVLVIGAGVSGVAAALAAARAGVKTILAEKENFLGGVGYSGLFQYICGLYLNGNTRPKETLNDGIVREIVSHLNKLSPQRTIQKIGQVYVLPYSREDLSSVFNSLCRDEPNLNVMFNATAVSVRKKGKAIVEVGLDQSETLHKITSRIVIECTGDGDVSAMSGADFELSSPAKRQLAGFTVHLKGLKNADETLAIKVPYHLSQAVKMKLLPAYLRFTSFTKGEAANEGFLKLNLGHENSRRHEVVLNNAEKALRYLADKLPALKNACIAGTSLRVMDREGRRICGEYVLAEDDIINARKFNDGVVMNSWPIEIWDKRKGTIYKYVKPGDYYEVPFRCLKAKGIDNLLIAGRCISVTHEALGSTRVMGTCISLGEQAGLAAAFKVNNGKFPFGDIGKPQRTQR
ncbi:MAG: FAD-dependent oxidoreductase [Nitrospirae bacterium]|nr:FAD-dependent oxidoreductase [Nitrospirota bacterium]